VIEDDAARRYPPTEESVVEDDGDHAAGVGDGLHLLAIDVPPRRIAG